MIAYVTLSFRFLSDVVVQLFVSPENVLSNGWAGKDEVEINVAHGSHRQHIGWAGKDQVDITVAHDSHRQHIEWRIGTINANDNWSPKIDVCVSLSTWSSTTDQAQGQGRGRMAA
jgi:hypothetical protein